MKASPSSVLAVVAGLGAAAVAAVLVAAPPERLVGLLVRDDAGYYLALARNHCRGLGWSVDGLTPTNGFNPLWAAMLAELTPRGCSVAGTWRAGMLLAGATLVVQVALLHAVARRLSGSAAVAAASATWWVCFVGLKGLHGTDAPLALLAATAWAWSALARGSSGADPSSARAETAQASPPPSPAVDGRRGMVLAALGGVALMAGVLARLDFAVLGAAAVLARAALQRRDPVGLLADLLGTSAGVAGVCAHALARGDSWLPISALVKSRAHLDVGAGVELLLGSSLNVADLATVILAAALIVPLLPWARRRGAIGVVVAALTAASAMRLLATLGFGRFDAQIGHLALALLALPAAGAAVSRDSARFRRGLVVALLASALAFPVAKAHRSADRRAAVERGAPTQAEVGRTLARQLPAAAVVFGGGFGLVGFFSERPWVNADGVVGSRALQQALEADALGPRLRDLGVTHLAALVPPGSTPHLQVPVHGTGGTLDLPLGAPVYETTFADRAPRRVFVVARALSAAGGD